MTDATLPVQAAIVAALKAYAPLTSIVGSRVYDNVPNGAQKPYVSIGPTQFLPASGECIDGGDVVIQLDGWSEGPTSVEAKQIGAAIIARLRNFAEALEDGARLVDFQIEQARYLREPDGVTQHAVVIVRAAAEPVA